MPNVNTVSGGEGPLSERIRALADSLQRLNQAGDLPTREGLISEGNRVLSLFFRDLNAPTTEVLPKIPNTPPSATIYNLFLQNTLQDLKALFAQLENLEDLSVAGFNFMLSETERIRALLQRVSSLTGDYLLYSESITTGLIFLTDTFSALDRVDYGSSLLTKGQCEVDPIQGVVTLPLDGTDQRSITLLHAPIIGPASNGVAGNNQQLGASKNSNQRSIIDGNPDTWFEYEKVVRGEDDTGSALILDLLLILDSEQLVNRLRVHPNNFGTPTPVSVINIETSSDGAVYRSIRDDVLGGGLDQGLDVFTLAPATSSFAGQAVYSFVPRRVKFVHFVLKQSSPYPIETTQGTKLRYAIGLRDIELQARRYKAIGELVSKAFSLQREARKIALSVTRDPALGSTLGSIRHFISPDDGGSWKEIRALEDRGAAGELPGVPEVLNFNVPGVEESIGTERPVDSLRYKVLLERNDGAFTLEGEGAGAGIEDDVGELLDAPTSSSSALSLSQSPAQPLRIQVLDPRIGARAKEDGWQAVYFMERTVPAGEASGTLRIPLPFDKSLRRIPDRSGGSLSLATPIRVRVDGETRTEAAPPVSPLGATTFSYDDERNVLLLNRGSLPTGSVVEFLLEEEPLLVEGRQELPREALLELPTVPDKEQVEIWALGPTTTAVRTMARGARVHRLEPRIVSTTFAATSVFTTPAIPFVDGRSELTGTGQYSVDTENGIAYSFDATSASVESIVSFRYTPARRLESNEWEFTFNPDGSVRGIDISESAFQSFAVTENITSGLRKFDLGRRAVLRGTVVPHLIDNSVLEPIGTEVDFIDGVQEFQGRVEVTLAVPAMSAGGVETTVFFSLAPAIASGFELRAQFSNTTVFASRQTSLASVNAVGRYFIDAATSLVHVRLAANTTVPEDQGGTVTYLYNDPSVSEGSHYAIDYFNGVLYTSANTPANLRFSYRYTQYVARYYAARKVSKQDYRVEGRQLTISDRELLRASRLPVSPAHPRSSTRSAQSSYWVYYRAVVPFDENPSELAPLYTPRLHDYKITVVPVGAELE